MKLKNPPALNILYIELSKLLKISEEFNENFFISLINSIPPAGKIEKGYFIVNNQLTVNNPNNIKVIELFNIFVGLSRKNYNLIQIIKPKTNNE